VFREALPVPLIAVEYSVDHFELTPSDADILVQLRGKDVLWQKERLYNIARGHLPPQCDSVLWIDCDIVLGGTEWPDQVRDALVHHDILQPFNRLEMLGPGVRPPPRTDDDVVDWRISLAAFLRNGGHPSDVYTTWGSSLQKKYFHGGAWAARRSFCDAFEYYDRMIVGGGDKAFSAALYGRFEDVAASSSFDDAMARDYVAWASALHRRLNGTPWHLETKAYHLWHGSLANRGYNDRLGKLRAAGFEGMVDIAIAPATQCWQWSTSKPGLHDFVRGHFVRRKEDG
jgi:hypothetical protein